MFDSAETLAADLEAFARRTTDTDKAATSPPRAEAGPRVGTEAGRLILLLAAGKSVAVPGVDINDAARVNGLITSARQVVSEVFLAPGADYFLNLGLSADATNDEIREHFRRLMAIVHPDAQPVGFPPDAAVRVNQAYGILSSQTDKTLYLDALVAPAGASNRRVRVAEGSRPASSRTHPAVRWSAVLAVLRSRQVLLWSALLLVFPVVFVLLSGLRQSEPVRLVESRRDEPATASALTTASPRDAMVVAATGTASAGDGIRSAAALPVPAAADAELRIGGMSLASGLSDRSLSRIASARATAPATSEGRIKVAADTSLAPITATGADTNAAMATNSATQHAPSTALPAQQPGSTIDSASRAPSAPRDVVSTVAYPPPAVASNSGGPSAVNSGTPAPPVATVTRVGPTQSVAPAAARAREIDDLLVRFASAYEAGSISSFGQLFSIAMNGRGQMLREYERMFSATQSRSIKFNQFKHTVTSERMATAGYATVTTTDQDNRTVTQRVFLEFEIGRDRGEPRIERLSNYAIN